MKLLYSLCFIVVQSSLEETGLIDYADLIGSGWTVKQATQNRLSYRRNSDRANFSIESSLVREDQDINYYWREWTLTSRRTKNPVRVPQSGIPVGDAAQLFSGFPGAIQLRVRVDRTLVGVGITYRGSGERGNIIWVNSDPLGDLERLEGAARHAVARIKARDFTFGPVITLNGRPISTTLRDESGRTFASLNGWAQARNISLNINVRRGTLAFTHNGRDYVTALGTDQIKVGATWKSMGAMAVRKGNTWYVPLQGIEAVIQ